MSSNEASRIAHDTFDLYREITEAIQEMKTMPVLFDDNLPIIEEKLKLIMTNFVKVSKEAFHYQYELETQRKF